MDKKVNKKGGKKMSGPTIAGMMPAIIIMYAVAIALIVIAYKKGDNAHIQGFKSGWILFRNTLPLVFAAFLIAGLIQVLVPEKFIINWLGVRSGLRGIMIGAVAGALTPGGPYISFPIVASLYRAGAGIGTVVAFVAAWSLWSLARFPYEISFIGAKFTLIRFLSTLIFPPLAGIIANTFFSKI